MALAIMAGAWCYHRGGWRQAMWCAGLVFVARVLDEHYGKQVGAFLADVVKLAIGA